MRHLQGIHGARPRTPADEGQVSVMVVLVVGLFLLLFVGFGVDMTNLFFHRQMAQNAADAACVAGAMDMLADQQGTASGGFKVGTNFDCNSTPTAAPCQYANLNGYNSAGSGIPAAGTESNYVSVSFPGSVPGVVTAPASIVGPNPFMQVDVYDGVKVYFSSLLSGVSTKNVHALAKCGLLTAQAPVPIIVLDPTEPSSFSTGGTPIVDILGGSTKSIQVNSGNVTAANIFGGATVDLTKGGPGFTGSDFGVWGGPGTAPGGFQTNPPAGWRSPASPIPDPFKSTPPPTDPGNPGIVTPNVLPGVNGCPAPTGSTCTEYGAGDYSTGINVQNQYAIFDPGVYYIKGGKFEAHANSLLRPSTAAGDNSLGTIFYLTGGAYAYIGADSGKLTATSFDTSRAHCPGDQPFPTQLAIPATVDGNVLMAPCTQDGTYPQAPQSKGVGPDRGMLFFSDRTTVPAPAETFNGGGGLMLVGTMYFRNCAAWPACVAPAGKKATDYQTSLTLVGGSGSNTRVLGEIVTDQLSLQGNSTITMDLNPWPLLNIVKVALLQ